MELTDAPCQPERRRALARLAALSALAATGLSACGGGSGGDDEQPTEPPPPGPPPPSPGPLRATSLASGLQYPWSLCFLPDGRLLVTEKIGQLRLLSTNTGGRGQAVSGLPAARYSGQGGLLDVVLDPAFASNRLIYVSYTEAEGDLNGLAVVRGVLSADATRVSETEVIFRQTPKFAGNQHYGGRLAFRSDGTLFITLGERFLHKEEAQNLGSYLGKVARIHSDGRIPADNPFVGVAGAMPALWSLGHRNPQGAAVHPDTGELWLCEHGPQGGDEINIARPGRNHGWPNVSYGCPYEVEEPSDACRIGGGVHAPLYVEPLTTWGPPSIAPSGLAFYTGNRFPEWRGHLFTGALAGKALWRLQFDGERMVNREALLTGLNARIRDVRQGPDGWLYILTDEASSGRVLRVER